MDAADHLLVDHAGHFADPAALVPQTGLVVIIRAAQPVADSVRAASESDSTAITVAGSLNPSVGTATATWQAETMGGDRFTGWRVTTAAILIDSASMLGLGSSAASTEHK
jgi:hypothetical protein